MSGIDPTAFLGAAGTFIAGVIGALAFYRKVSNEGAGPVNLLRRWLDWISYGNPEPPPPDGLLDDTRAALKREQKADDDHK